MKNKLIKTAFLEIKARKKIFISIMFMSLLGVGFFAGIKATSPAMKDTIDSYYQELNMYDIELMSSLGINDDVLDKIKEIPNVESVSGIMTSDVIASYNDKKAVLKVHSITDDINKLHLVEGRLPENSLECVLDERFKKSNLEFRIGDYIEIDNNLFKNKKLKVVGIVNSPIYISAVRGSTTLGTGTIDYFMYVPKDNFMVQNIYTSAYIKINTSNKTYSSKYLTDVDLVIEELKKID